MTFPGGGARAGVLADFMLAIFPADHFLTMVLYALLLSMFLAVLWASDRPARLALFAKIFGALVIGGLAVAWLMYPFPS